MDKGQKALIVIPTYNEAENLEPLVEQIQALPVRLDLLVVDDNSPDGTGEIADRLAASLPTVHVMHRTGKQGLGTAYIAGFRWALGRDYAYVLEMDCDFSHPPRYLPTFLECIQHADLVIGSRYVPEGGTPDWGLVRRLISAGGNFFAATVARRSNGCPGTRSGWRAMAFRSAPSITSSGWAGRWPSFPSSLSIAP